MQKSSVISEKLKLDGKVAKDYTTDMTDVYK